MTLAFISATNKHWPAYLVQWRRSLKESLIQLCILSGSSNVAIFFISVSCLAVSNAFQKSNEKKTRRTADWWTRQFCCWAGRPERELIRQRSTQWTDGAVLGKCTGVQYNSCNSVGLSYFCIRRPTPHLAVAPCATAHGFLVLTKSDNVIDVWWLTYDRYG